MSRISEGHSVVGLAGHRKTHHIQDIQKKNLDDSSFIVNRANKKAATKVATEKLH